MAGRPAALSKAFWHPWAWLARCLRLRHPLPFPSPPVCGVSSKAVPFRNPTAVATRRVQGCGHRFGRGARVQPRCQISRPPPCSPLRFRVGTREAELTQCSQRLGAILGEPVLGPRGLGGRWLPTSPSLVSEASREKGPAGASAACGPQHVCSGNAHLIKEWDGEDPTLTTHQQQLHTHAPEEVPSALVGAGGPGQPLLTRKLRPRVQSICLAGWLSLRGRAGSWAALLSGRSGGGPELSFLRGQAQEAGGLSCPRFGRTRALDLGRLTDVPTVPWLVRTRNVNSAG